MTGRATFEIDVEKTLSGLYTLQPLFGTLGSLSFTRSDIIELYRSDINELYTPPPSVSPLGSLACQISSEMLQLIAK